MFSLGRIPYPAVDNAEVLKTLKSGERLDKPDLCPSDVYVNSKVNILASHNCRDLDTLIEQSSAYLMAYCRSDSK